MVNGNCFTSSCRVNFTTLVRWKEREEEGKGEDDKRGGWDSLPILLPFSRRVKTDVVRMRGMRVTYKLRIIIST